MSLIVRRGTLCYISAMPELLEQTLPEFTTLPIVLNGELTERFDSPDLLEEPPKPETTASPTNETLSDAQLVAMSSLLATAEAVDIDFTPTLPEKPSLRDRLIRSRLGRLAIGSLTALGLAAGGVAVEASPAGAASNPVYTVTNHDHDGTHGIYYRNSPSMSDSIRSLPYYAKYGDRIELICGTNGEAVGQYNNHRWHLAKDLDNPKAPNQFYIPDHDTNTPNKANQPTPGERECVDGANPQPLASNSTPDIKACYYNMKAPSTNLTFSYDGSHRYLGNAWQAAKNWTDLNTGITIKSGSGKTYIEFKDVYIKNDKGYYAHTEIPATSEWQGPLNKPPKSPHIPSHVVIDVNQYLMDKLDDFHRTLVLAHEIGHTLGLAHPEVCGVANKSLEKRGGNDVPKRTFNTPQYYDRIELEELYGLPIH